MAARVRGRCGRWLVSLLVAAAILGSSVVSADDECLELLETNDCSNSGASCGVFLGQCKQGTAPPGTSQCCVPALVSYSYVSAGVTVEDSDLVDLEQCSMVPGMENTFKRFDPESAPACSNAQAVPQILTGPSCASGILCDFDITLCDMNTWPQYCSPDTDCSVDLLLYQYCSSQSQYVPKVCQPGHYCSRKTHYDSVSEKKDCPSGSYCIMGTENPIKCDNLSVCHKKSKNPVQFGCLIYMLAFDLVLLDFMRRRGRQQIRMQSSVIAHKGTLPPKMAIAEGSAASNEPLLGAAAASPEEVSAETNYAELDSSTYHLVRGFTRARGRIFSLDFTFDKLGLILPNGNAILQSVSARVRPGKVTAIMGPSGAGKTTLLNTLMGKQSPSFKQTGTLKINGKVKNIKDFRSVIGFVPQDDIMIRELTVRDNIEYSARVRLPPSWTEAEIRQHVDAVLDALSLSHVQHTRIGDEKTRGVSGGQRKRVNIGIEVVACPVALYLDEPTSGLDATAALQVTDALKNIAHTTGITVAMVIHQPRYEIWEALDEVLFLAPGGRTVFLGNLAEVQPYFQSKMGMYPQERDNPADFYMDRIADSADRCVQVWQQHAARQQQQEEEEQQGGVDGSQEQELGPAAAMAAAAAIEESGGARNSSSSNNNNNNNNNNNRYSQRSVSISTGINVKLQDIASAGHSVSAAELEAVLAECGVLGDVKTQSKLLLEAYDKSQTGYLSGPELNTLLTQIQNDERGASFWKQLVMAHNRSINQQLNRPVSILIELGTVSFAGALMGFAAKNPYTGIIVKPYTLLSPANQVVLVPMSAMFVGMAVGLAAAPTGVHSFGSELVVYWREASVGHSKLAYFIGKSFSNSYRMLIGALHFCGWYLLLAETILTPTQLYSVVLMLFYSVYGMACVVSMILPIDTANLVAVVVALLVPVFGGFVRNLRIGIKHSTYSWWANEAFFSYAIEPYKGIYQVDKTAHVWSYTLNQESKDLVMVFIIGCIYRLIAFGCMVRLNREKQS